MGGNPAPVKISAKEVNLDNSKKGTCENEQLKQQEKYFIEKFAIKDGTSIIYYSFKAVLNEGDQNKLSELKAEHGGICNNVKTEKGSENCGLATAIMVSCFEDKDITEIGDFDFDKQFESHPQYQKEAEENCAKMVMVACRPDPSTTTTIEACIAYLNAAFKASYEMMFMIKDVTTSESMDVKKVTAARRDFKRDQKVFVEQHGVDWLFCKCKKEKITKCLDMN